MSYLYQKELKVDSRTETPEKFIRHFNPPEEFVAFFREIVLGVEQYQQEIDKLIEEHAENWKLYRIAKTDLAVLRIGVWELLYCPETDYQVVIDEAVELAKSYGSQDSASFVNGILDPIATKIRKKK